VGEQIAFWLFGLALGGAITVAVGKSLVDDHGRKVIPALVAAGVVLGVLIGWALSGYIDYVRYSATIRQ
jgi:hypothetical protein